MAENAQVSEATAKRWLKAMTHDWLVEEKYVNGQNQYLNRELLAIIDDHARR
jgi:transposase